METPKIQPGTVAFVWTPYAAGGGGIHPVIIVAHDVQCNNAPAVLAVPGTSNVTRPPLPTHYQPDPTETGLQAVTRFRCENVTPIETAAIKGIVGRISRLEYMKLQQCLMRAFHLEQMEW